MKRAIGLLILAFALSGCDVPAVVAIPIFTTAVITGTGVAVGAGTVDLGWHKLPIHQPSVAPTATEK
jgi:hypothetical protein